MSALSCFKASLATEHRVRLVSSMHGQISAFPSAFFYGGRLRNAPLVLTAPDYRSVLLPLRCIASPGCQVSLAARCILSCAWRLCFVLR